ncbi:hypothetical protein Agub_g13986 [Astrephomene gubernaculifera]|uniref:PAS domain-containing protein n=1 Tax=Astrephomene gubernaculifera TaxID=47775 RepID=A0AAD3E547_9CHLO|nr:hypothetical protein Agub_g13986 [Astrephomene gubernaculifera]
MARSDAGSERSGGMSETSSAADAMERLHKRHAAGMNQEEEEDLLEQNKTLQEAVFTSMYLLAKNKRADNWKLATTKILLEALIPFLVVFNPNHWPIDTSNPLWQVVRWLLPRVPITKIWGYDTYMGIFYFLVALIFGVVAAIAALTLAMRKQENSKWLKKFARLLQIFTDAMFGMLYVAIFDFIAFLFSCHYGAKGGAYHDYWPDVKCLSGKHLAHLVAAGVTAVVFFVTTGLMLVAGCELSPLARGITASPAAATRLKVLVLKAFYVIAAVTLVSLGKLQSVLMFVSVFLITYFNIKTLPFLRMYVNYAWTAGWFAVTYLGCVHMVMDFHNPDDDPHVGRRYMHIVLYGVFPAALFGAGVTALWAHNRLRPAAKFLEIEPDKVVLRKVHKFWSPEDVEVIARSMRRFNSDGVVLEERALLGGVIIKAGMAVFPGHVGLLVLYANYLMEVRGDGPAARTHLQLALKGGPSLVQRYQIFSTVENSKRLKDGQEGALDLQSYVEFKRNYRAVIRVHKAALTAQREFWQLLQRSAVRMSAVEEALKAMDRATQAAQQVYLRVLERYPSNGKLLRCYGKFLEDVKNDPAAAGRAYVEAARNGGSDGLLSLDLQVTGPDKPEFLTTMDLHEDACIVINAEGTILMVNACVTDLLGYSRSELEGANVSMIMPQPFAGRHSSYLAHYVQGGVPQILDTVRDVVALHKERYVFPLQLCVTKLSGIGTDSVFLGLLRPAQLDAHNVRIWVSPTGAILCADPQFASLTGMQGEEMVNCNFRNLATDMTAVDDLLEKCRNAHYALLRRGGIETCIELAHKYLPPIPVKIRVTPGGTDAQRIYVLNAHRIDGNTDGLMVVDSKGTINFATWDVAALLGYPLRQFLKMKLEQLLPEPIATMHGTYVRDPPHTILPTSCRAGRVVHLVNSNGTSVAVRLRITSKEDDVALSGGRVKHVMQVAKVDASNPVAMYHDKRLVLLCSMDGKILSVDQPDSALFGFAAGATVGTYLADCIDVFAEWREKAGGDQMQQLLLLSLLDKENEMPGTSWRVKVHSPDSEDRLPPIDPRMPHQRHASGRSACLQAELVDVDSALKLAAAAGGDEEGGQEGSGTQQGVASRRHSLLLGLPARYSSNGIGANSIGGGASGKGDLLMSEDLHGKTVARIILWRRDLLMGVVELDEHLVVRKADVSTGLIVGLPPSALQRMPLHRLLDIPKGAIWNELMVDKKAGNRKKRERSALKGANVVSAAKAFVGSHPDGGSMRIMIQGVRSSTGGNITATLHPDTAYVGARANVYRSLGLEALITNTQGSQQQQQQQQQEQPPAVTSSPYPQPPLQQQPLQQQVQSSALTTPFASTWAQEHLQQQQHHHHHHHHQEHQQSHIHHQHSANRHVVVVDSIGSGAAARASSTGGTLGGKGSAVAPHDAESYPSLSSGPADNEACSQDPHARVNVSSGSSSADGDGDDDKDGEEADGREEEQRNNETEAAKMYKRTHNQSEFVAQWVQSVARHMAAALEQILQAAATPGEAGAGPAVRQGSSLKRRASGQSISPSPEPGAAEGEGDRSHHHHHHHHHHHQQQQLALHHYLSTQTTDNGGANGLTSPDVAAAVAVTAPLTGHGSAGGSALQPLYCNPFVIGGGFDPLSLPVSAEAERARTSASGHELGSHANSPQLTSPPAGDAPTVQISVGPQLRTGEAAGAIEAITLALDEVNNEHHKGLAQAPFKRGESTGFNWHALDRKRSDEDVDEPSGPGSDGGGGGGDTGSVAGDDEDGIGAAAGQALSDIASTTELDVNVDARRARLLKRMKKVLIGPSLSEPLARLFLRTLLLLFCMAATHAICYVVLMRLIDSQYTHVHQLHRVALAADRCQVASIKATVMDFCSQPDIAPVSFCTPSLNSTVIDMRAALDDLESYHQGTYLGTGKVPEEVGDPLLQALWTNPLQSYRFYMDLSEPRWTNLTAGVWQLGNRFIAAGRELLYWGKALEGRIGSTRSFRFLLFNGHWSLFSAYAASLDLVARAAWEDVTTLQRSLVILLLVEAALVQLACICWEWLLVRRVELGRRGGLLAGLGLPGPILRVLASKPLVVLEDSEDEEAEDQAANTDGHEGHTSRRHSTDGYDDLTAATSAADLDQALREGQSRTRRRSSMEYAPIRISFPGTAGTADEGGVEGYGNGDDVDGRKGNIVGAEGSGGFAAAPMRPRVETEEGDAGGGGDRPRRRVQLAVDRPRRVSIETGEAQVHYIERKVEAVAAVSTSSMAPRQEYRQSSMDTGPIRTPATTAGDEAGEGAGHPGSDLGGNPNMQQQRLVRISSPSGPRKQRSPEPRVRLFDDSPPRPVVPVSAAGLDADPDPREKAAPVMELLRGSGGGAGSPTSSSGNRRSAALIAWQSAGRLAINGKVLSAGWRHYFKFMAPLVLWEIALVASGGISYLLLEGMQGPLASLNMASHVLYRYTRVRMLSLLLVTSASATERASWRSVLSYELGNLENEYDTLLYGGTAITQNGSVFTHPVPSSTFESSSFSSNFFKEQRCFRWDQSQCYTEGSPYYEVTHHGLDVMMRRTISEMSLLVQDADADATYNGTRYTTIYMVGVKDLYEGLQSSAQLFVDFMLSRYTNVKLLHTVLLAATIVLFILYALLILRPYRTAIEREAVRLAGILSHVPAEVDVLAHTRQVLRTYDKLILEPAASRPGAAAGKGGGGKWRRRRRSEVGAAATSAGAGGGGGGDRISPNKLGGKGFQGVQPRRGSSPRMPKQRV